MVANETGPTPSGAGDLCETTPRPRARLWRRLLLFAAIPPALVLLLGVWWYVYEAHHWHTKREWSRLVGPARFLSEVIELSREERGRYPATADEVWSLRGGGGKPVVKLLIDGARELGVELADVTVPEPVPGRERVLVVVSGPKGRVEILPEHVVRISAAIAGHHLPKQIEPGSWVQIIPEEAGRDDRR